MTLNFCIVNFISAINYTRRGSDDSRILMTRKVVRVGVFLQDVQRNESLSDFVVVQFHLLHMQSVVDQNIVVQGMATYGRDSPR